MLGIVPLFAPLYLATQNLALALNLWIMSTFVFSGLAAGVAGIAYAFAPWRLLELSHVQLLSVQYLPLLVYAILRSARARDPVGWLSIFGLAMILSLSSYDLGYMGFTLAAIVMGEPPGPGPGPTPEDALPPVVPGTPRAARDRAAPAIPRVRSPRPN